MRTHDYADLGNVASFEVGCFVVSLLATPAIATARVSHVAKTRFAASVWNSSISSPTSRPAGGYAQTNPGGGGIGCV